MKTVEKNGVKFIYVDNNVMNSDRYATNFFEGEEAQTLGWFRHTQQRVIPT